MPPIIPRRLLVRYTGTRRTCQRNHFGPSEANLATPAGEISASEVERCAEVDQYMGSLPERFFRVERLERRGFASRRYQ